MCTATMSDTVHLHLVSDSTGETVNACARACLVQFNDIEPHEHVWSLVRSAKQMDKVLAGIRANPGPVLFTVMRDDLRTKLVEACQDMNVPCIPVLDPVMHALAAHFGVPCFVDNEVNVMALGEARAGRAGESESFLFVKIGTGIGAGLVINGELYHGFKGSAGDIGHIGIDGETTRCPCGNRGCLEVVAGGTAIADKGRELAKSGASPMLAEAATRLAAEDPPREVTAVEVAPANHKSDWQAEYESALPVYRRVSREPAE